MTKPIDHTRLHRTAKYFMDNGKAQSHDEAMAMLHQFGLSIHAGPEVHRSKSHQIALLTLVNLARRTFLGGVEVVGIGDTSLLTTLGQGHDLSAAVIGLGGQVSATTNPSWPKAIVGTADSASVLSTIGWQLSWEGWRGGVFPLRWRKITTIHSRQRSLQQPAPLNCSLGTPRITQWPAGGQPACLYGIRRGHGPITMPANPAYHSCPRAFG
jgi:hypothetical protein